MLDSNFYKSTSGNVLQEICAICAYLLSVATLMQVMKSLVPRREGICKS